MKAYLAYGIARWYANFLEVLLLPPSEPDQTTRVHDEIWRAGDLAEVDMSWLGVARDWAEERGIYVSEQALAQRHVGPSSKIKFAEKIDVLVSEGHHRHENGLLRHHLCTRELPAGTILRIDEHTLVSSPELLLIQLATVLDDVDLLLCAYELCGSYAKLPEGLVGRKGYGFVNRAPVTTVERCLDVANSTSLDGTKRTRRVLKSTRNDSASLMETSTAILLGSDTKSGGFGLGEFAMNAPVRLSEEGARIVGCDELRGDIVYADPRWAMGLASKKGVIIEYLGKGDHFDPVLGKDQAACDNRRRRAFEASGWVVICITAKEFESLRDMTSIATRIATTLGLVVDYTDEAQMAKRRELHRRLLEA